MRPSRFRDHEARAAYAALYARSVSLCSMSMAERDVDTSFGLTHVLSAGDPGAPPLVALHAKSCSATMWLPFVEVLAARHRVHLVDAVGDLGMSVATEVLSSPARVVAWLDEVLARLGIERTAIVSASIGTWMAAHYTLQCPERVERLAMLSPVGMTARLRAGFWRAALPAMVRPNPEKVGRFFDWMATPAGRTRLATDPWRSVRAQFVHGTCGFVPNWREAKPARCDVGAIGRSGIPLLVLIGRHECLLDGPTMAASLQQQWPGAAVEVVDGASHLVFVDRPDIVADRLATFLAGAPEAHRAVG